MEYLTKNRGIKKELFEQILNAIQTAQVYKTTGIAVKYLAEGIAGLTMEAKQDFTNMQRLLHGGIIVVLADTAMGLSMSTLGLKGPTLELNINYLEPVSIGIELTAEGCVVRAGKNTVVAEADIFNNEGKLVAKSRGTFYVKESTRRDS